MYSVKEVASITQLSDHAVRFYTDKGLVPSVQRDKNNIRQFDEKSINWLIGIKNLKQTGMSIKELKNYVDLCLMGDSTIPNRYEILLKQHAVAQNNLREAQMNVEFVEKKIKNYLLVMNANQPDGMNPDQWDTDGSMRNNQTESIAKEVG